jgi:GNAT superfamily N-acetyltransferase
MTLQISIRKALAADVDTLVRMSHAGGPEGERRGLLPETLPDGYYQAFERIQRDPNQFLMVAETDAEIVGTFHMTYLTYLPAAGREDCQIENVHVKSHCRGQGIGTIMMRWAIAKAQKRGCRRLQLTTNKQRKDAHRFYERLGFIMSHEGAKLSLLVEAR